MVRWREAMAAALYGPAGFYSRPGPGPAGHFRTSVHAATAPFAAAIGRLLARLDEALEHPDPLEVVDVGAGRGELLTALPDAVPPELAGRLRLTGVEVAPPRPGPPEILWRTTLPDRPVTGLLLATEWLDNVPVDVAEVDTGGAVRYLLVDPSTGEEAHGPPVAGPDADWLARWWPVSAPGSRAEIGRPRDESWAAAVAVVARGAALAVDYGHRAGARPPYGTLTGFRHGREVPPVPDGSCDLTAHVAIDAVAHAGRRGGAYARGAVGDEAPGPVVVRQRAALRALGVDGSRPPRERAERDPAGYLRALATAGAAAELTDPAGLGGHWWVLQPVGIAPEHLDPVG